jgi:outer membrane protein assembly factor BamB
VAPGEEHGVSEPSTSARGGLAVPGLGTAPVVNGDTLITVEQNLLRVRDLTSGKVRWERKADAGREFVQAPTSAGDQVYAVATGEGQQAVAYSLADGKRQWTRALGQGTGIEGLQVPYKVLGLAGKTLVVNSESGLQSLDPGSGRPLGTFDRTGGNDSFDQETCSNVVLQPTYVLCHRSGIDSGKPSVTWQLKPRTLKPVRELSRTNPELRASDTLLRDGDSAVLIGRQLNQDRVFAVDLTTGKTRWTGTMVSQNAEESPAVPMAGPLLLGGQAVEATDRHLVTLSVKGSGGGGSPASVRKAAEQPLDKPADGSPGRWARSVAVESARRPALLSLPGVLFAIGGDGAVRSIKPPG